MWTFTKTLNSILICGMFFPLVGCVSTSPTGLTPARDVLNAGCCEPDNETQLNFLKLRQSPPQEYVLDGGDTLGVYIQGITGDKDIPPPVHFPENGGQPALGYPVPIRDDGYISLPLVAPVRVTGLTIGEAEAKIVRAYTKDKKILLEGAEKIIVSLIQPRNYNVLVIREDLVGPSQQSSLNRNEVFIGDSTQSETFSIELPAYENDVLHALSETGGLPTERARNEIVVLRGGLNSEDSDSIVRAIGGGQSSGSGTSTSLEQANIIRIPIKAEEGQFPQLSEADITLEDGDIVYIKGREQDVFYTGGLLDGGRFPLPRDYQIDVLEAIALAGGSASATAGASGGALSRVGSLLPATQVTVLRKCGCEQVAIDVDLRYTLAEPSERVIIQPGDLIVLEFRKNELAVNAFASIFQIGGIFNLFR